MASLENNVRLIPDFLSTFLSKDQTSIYRGASWLVVFQNPESLRKAIKIAGHYEPFPWDTAKGAAYVTKNEFNQRNGCMFAQAISIPGESFQPIPGGNISTNAFIRPYVGAGRNSFPLLRMSFLETVVSFADNFLRPWVLATQTFGMLAPQYDWQNYRTTIECYKLSPHSFGSNQVPDIAMKYVFYDACCVSVGDEEFNYNPITSPVLRDAQFVYSSYAINPTTETSNDVEKNPVQDTTTPRISFIKAAAWS
jgi:hypothetical protein